jgi:acyl-coenzyme A thioesterase PaaI-like protein
MGVSLGDAPPGYEKVPNPPVEVVDSPDLPPLTSVFGAARGGDGLWRLPPITPELSSPHAALHLGPITIVLEAAAVQAASAQAGTDALQVDAFTVMFVRPGTVGPFRAEARTVGRGTERIAVQVTLHDEGRGDRAVSVATATFHRV